MSEKKEPEKKEKTPVETVYKCELELVRVNKFTARYRVVNPAGALTDFNHIEFDRKALPNDVDFNMDFINSPLLPDEDGVKPDKGTRAKQANFRKFMRFKMVIVRES